MSNETPDRMDDGAANEGRMHELLCAYILGEVNADERAEVERALAESEALRLEKAQIERTIGFVQTALVGDDVLSPAAREEVLRAAMPTPVIPMWRRTWVRAAASVLFVSFALGGWAIYQRNMAADCGPVNRREVALLDDKRKSGVDSLRGSGYIGTDARDEDESRRAGETDAKAAENKPETPALAAAASKGTYRGPGDSVVAGGGEKSADSVESIPRMIESTLGSSVPKEAGNDAGALAKSKLGQGIQNASQIRSRSLDASTASDDEVIDQLYGVGKSTSQNEVIQEGAEVEILRKAEELSFQAGGAGPSTPAPSGPSTGGPSSPAPSGPSTGGPSGSTAIGVGGPGSYAGRTIKKGRQGVLSPRAPSPGKSKKLDDTTGKQFEGLGYTSAGAGDGAPREADSGDMSTKAKDGQQPWANNREVAPGAKYYGWRDTGLARAQDELSDEDQFIQSKLQSASATSGFSMDSGALEITPELRAKYRDEYVADWCRRVVQHCQPRPNERPRDMFFRFWGDNPFEFAALDALSTFSADVDTASYTLARRFINEGHIPEKAQVRTEEFVNAFKPDVPAPEKGTFAIQTTLAPSRFGAANPGESVTSARDMLRVVIRGKDVPKAERKPMALTFVVDVSGSMKEQNRIEMVKHAMRLLVSQLDARDSIAIVKFSTDAALVLPMTSAKQKDLIESAIFPLDAEGSTNSEAGLRMGYAAALAGMNVEGTNRVVFLSDGVANVGVTDSKVISDEVKTIREKGIYLNTVGVGMNNHNDELLEQLADKGDGVCNYVDSPSEAKKVFVDQFMGTLETIARDVKLQVEFDPAQVFRYRLLGYENRAIADADFRNDKVDAGEVGAGHQVTALYEIEYANVGAASDKPLATVRVRYKAPRNLNAPTSNEEASEIQKTVSVAQRTSWEGAGASYRRSVLAAQFAEFLRRSVHARSDSFDQMIADAKKLETDASDAETSELVTLMEKSKALILNGWPNRDELAQAVDLIRENCLRRAELERVATEKDRELLASIEEQNRKLEERLRELMRHRLEQQK